MGLVSITVHMHSTWSSTQHATRGPPAAALRPPPAAHRPQLTRRPVGASRLPCCSPRFSAISCSVLRSYEEMSTGNCTRTAQAWDGRDGRRGGGLRGQGTVPQRDWQD